VRPGAAPELSPVGDSRLEAELAIPRRASSEKTVELEALPSQGR